jgi:hypothetical protein
MCVCQPRPHVLVYLSPFIFTASTGESHPRARRRLFCAGTRHARVGNNQESDEKKEGKLGCAWS